MKKANKRNKKADNSSAENAIDITTALDLLMERIGLTQEELGKLFGVRQNTISSYCKHRIEFPRRKRAQLVSLLKQHKITSNVRYWEKDRRRTYEVGILEGRIIELDRQLRECKEEIQQLRSRSLK